MKNTKAMIYNDEENKRDVLCGLVSAQQLFKEMVIGINT